jgi:cytochrome c-type biogenesis protein CcmH/NrfG
MFTFMLPLFAWLIGLLAICIVALWLCLNTVTRKFYSNAIGIFLCVGLVLGSSFLYKKWGSYEALYESYQLAAFDEDFNTSKQNLVLLEHKFSEVPVVLEKIAEIWFSMKNYSAAIRIYQTLLDHDPEDIERQWSLAQALFIAEQGRLSPSAQVLISSILSKAPQHELARNLRAMDNFQRGNYAAAIEGWQALYEVAGTAESKKLLYDLIAQAKRLSSGSK